MPGEQSAYSVTGLRDPLPTGSPIPGSQPQPQDAIREGEKVGRRLKQDTPPEERGIVPGRQDNDSNEQNQYAQHVVPRMRTLTEKPGARVTVSNTRPYSGQRSRQPYAPGLQTDLVDNEAKNDQKPIVVFFQEQQCQRNGQRPIGVLPIALAGRNVCVEAGERQAGTQALQHHIGRIGALRRTYQNQQRSDQTADPTVAGRGPAYQQIREDRAADPAQQARQNGPALLEAARHQT